MRDKPQNKSALKRKEVKTQEDVLSVSTSSPESDIIELTDFDTPPPSKNRPRATSKTPAVGDVRMREHVVQGASIVDQRVVWSVAMSRVSVGVS